MREELITSAITFLQDPTVAASPLEKRVAFLQSKNLTQEEINESLRRTGEGGVSTALATVSRPSSSSNYSSPAPYYAPQQQQPDLPGRDWRDWFIMATVTGGVGYGLFYLTKRYVYPLIAPPTPPQLEQDKTEIDEKFKEAFDVLDTLKTDTAILKNAEEERKARVDAALEEVESVVRDLKDAGKRREDESKRVGDEVRSLRDLIPKALEGQKDQQKKALEDLQTELQSLKNLVITRTAAARPSYVSNGITGTPPLDPGSAASAGASGGQQALGTGGTALGGLGRKDPLSFATGGVIGGSVGGKIPAWQMAQGRANSTPPNLPVPAPKTNGDASDSAAPAS
ncbi:peroxisomal membrane anchor protein conserved region-domain-containing protein [Geopyxis carbonaria]|nr:peroxisomal membrane anchor protein conserved region-domain-containing protein [Geopyxis carbonaria]